MNPQQNNNPAPNTQPRGIYPVPFNGPAVGTVSDIRSTNSLQQQIATPSPSNDIPAAEQNNSWMSSHHGWRSVVSTILLLAIAPLIAFAITAFAVQSYQVDGESMETTLQNGDRLIVDKVPRTMARITGHQYIPHRGDIIIFNQANLPDSSFGQTKQLIKRVVGLPGERVVVNNNKVTIFNSANPKGFNPDTSTGYHITAKQIPGDVDVTLNQNQLFVCGDNRPNSEDSRYFGPISTNDIVGKLVLRLLPINKTESF